MIGVTSIKHEQEMMKEQTPAQKLVGDFAPKLADRLIFTTTFGFLYTVMLLLLLTGIRNSWDMVTFLAVERAHSENKSTEQKQPTRRK
jgi:hypothetical protein